MKLESGRETIFYIYNEQKRTDIQKNLYNYAITKIE